jgi:transcription initiation factor TFIID subunit 8
VETLADIALRYLSDIGKAAHFYANLAGRTQCNAFDVILALEDMGPGAAVDTSTRCLANSSALRDVMRYVEFAEEIPFARPVPKFPVFKKRTPPPTFAQLGEQPPFAHIPPWLPAFPDPHTYQSTPVWVDRKSDPRMDKLELARQRRKAERSLFSLHLRLSSATVGGDGPPSDPVAPRALPKIAGALTNGSTEAQPPTRQQWPLKEQPQQEAVKGAAVEPAKVKGKRPSVPVVQNPFLASPLQAGEKEVTAITLTGRNFDKVAGRQAEGNGQVAFPSVLEAFAPMLESAKSGARENAGSTIGSPLREQQAGSAIPEAKERIPVSLKFDFGKKARAKAIAAQMSLGRSPSPPPPPPSKRGKAGGSAGKEEEKDEKRRRAELILAQSMDDTEDNGTQT